MLSRHTSSRLDVVNMLPIQRSLFPVVFIALLLLAVRNANGYALKSSSRRTWLKRTFQGILIGTTINSANAQDELPLFLRDFTALAPLGTPLEESNKSLGLSLAELATRLTRDLTEGATGQGGYFLTGDLSKDIFRDDCVFVDPTNRVSSLSQYQRALRILFDPSQSSISLLGELSVNEKERTISGRLRSRGVLQLPWKPYINAYETDIVYRIDENGLICQQEQQWSKSASQALKETFTPTLLEPPPKSTRLATAREPGGVSKLFDYINGRRPNEYTQEERFEIAALIDKIATKAQAEDFQRELLPGKWILAYLQPGPDGGGIDRRIPFPEFDFNNNYQVFGRDSVVNVGELLGPLAEVRVEGDLQEDDPSSARVPKRFQAHIQGGKLCVSDKCIRLPIQGEGLFESVYLGERLRIGKNLNGGGARVIQLRLD
jgi:hypothetical protein